MFSLAILAITGSSFAAKNSGVFEIGDVEFYNSGEYIGFHIYKSTFTEFPTEWLKMPSDPESRRRISNPLNKEMTQQLIPILLFAKEKKLPVEITYEMISGAYRVQTLRIKQ